jgi:serine/threonine-protein kinase
MFITASPTVPRKIAVLFALTLGTVSVARPRAAHAQSTAGIATAQALFDDARALMAKGNYDEACPKLEESQQLDPGSGTLLNLGDCYEHQGRFASAWSMFLEAAAAARTTGNVDRDRASRERASALDARLARLTIRVAEKTAGLEVRRDGVVVRSAQWGTAIPADAGAHTITATAPGRQAWHTTVTLRDGIGETVLIPALPEAPKPGDTLASGPAHEPGKSNPGALGTQRIVALAAGGVGLAGIAVGTIFGLESKSLRDESQAPGVCTKSACETTQGVELIDQARYAGDVSTVAFVVGAAGLIAGATLWFTAPRSVAQIALGMGTVQIRGSW